MALNIEAPEPKERRMGRVRNLRQQFVSVRDRPVTSLAELDQKLVDFMDVFVQLERLQNQDRVPPKPEV